MDCIETAVGRSMTAFPARFKTSLALSGKTLKQVARETGIAYGTVASYMRGERNPTMSNIVALCLCLGESADWLLGLGDGR